MKSYEIIWVICELYVMADLPIVTWRIDHQKAFVHILLPIQQRFHHHQGIRQRCSPGKFVETERNVPWTWSPLDPALDLADPRIWNKFALLWSHLPRCSFSERHWDIHSPDSSRQKHRKYLQDKTKTFSPDWTFREKSSLHCFSPRCTIFYPPLVLTNNKVMYLLRIFRAFVYICSDMCADT